MATATKMKFRIKEGIHAEGRPPKMQEYTKGQVIESEEDLAVKYVNKFERVYEEGTLKVANAPPPQAQVPVPVQTAQETQEEAEPATPPVIPGNDFRDNVTSLFPKATETGLQVYQGDDGKFRVIKPPNLQTNLAEKPLKRSEVDKCIASLKE